MSPTFSLARLRRQRQAHSQSDGYGQHRHLYLHGAMHRLATQVGVESWLDYGCGKGGFIEQVRPMGLFAVISGYDPAVGKFQARPTERHDLVTCLDVLDVVEPRFRGAVLDDINSLTGKIAVIDVMTLPKVTRSLPPHPPFYWVNLIRPYMEVVDTLVEYAGVQDFERVIITAKPSDRPRPAP